MAGKKKSRIVVEAPAAEASARFIEWLTRNPKVAFRLNPADIKVEQYCDADGQTVIRYRVHVAPSADLEPKRTPEVRPSRRKPSR
jgi:hypothetical protein